MGVGQVMPEVFDQSIALSVWRTEPTESGGTVRGPHTRGTRIERRVDLLRWRGQAGSGN